MIYTDDGENFVITLKQGTVELSRDELEALVIEGEILLHDLKDVFIEPDSGNVNL